MVVVVGQVVSGPGFLNLRSLGVMPQGIRRDREETDTFWTPSKILCE